MKLYKYSEQKLREAILKSTSKRQVLQKLDVSTYTYGGNYDVLKKAIKHFNLDTSLFTGQAWNRGKKLPPKRPTKKYLNNEFPIQSFKLKNRLLKEGLFQ